MNTLKNHSIKKTFLPYAAFLFTLSFHSQSLSTDLGATDNYESDQSIKLLAIKKENCCECLFDNFTSTTYIPAHFNAKVLDDIADKKKPTLKGTTQDIELLKELCLKAPRQFHRAALDAILSINPYVCVREPQLNFYVRHHLGYQEDSSNNNKIYIDRAVLFNTVLELTLKDDLAAEKECWKNKRYQGRQDTYSSDDLSATVLRRRQLLEIFKVAFKDRVMHVKHDEFLPEVGIKDEFLK